MRLVADTNVFFSFFNERSRAREIIILGNVLVYAPAFAVTELRNHAADIRAAFSLTPSQYGDIMELLGAVATFVDEEEYKTLLLKARSVSPDPDDVDFVALAMKLGCPLWSNDKRLRRQSAVQVLSTEELVKVLGM